jgi:glutamate 5-kinase
MSARLSKARRIVVKVGSALLVDQKSGLVKAAWLSSLVDDLAGLRDKGAEVILVSSGAIALGRRTLGWPKGKLDLAQSQAAAAVGQIALAQAWSEVLRVRNIVAARNRARQCRRAAPGSQPTSWRRPAPPAGHCRRSGFQTWQRCHFR